MRSDKLGAAADAVQPLFITLDPERDTQKVLADYVPMFHQRMIGLRGDTEALKQVADAYRVYYKKAPTGDALGYTVDHSGFVYLMGPDRRYLGFFPPGTSAERMAAAIKPHLLGAPKKP